MISSFQYAACSRVSIVTDSCQYWIVLARSCMSNWLCSAKHPCSLYLPQKICVLDHKKTKASWCCTKLAEMSFSDRHLVLLWLGVIIPKQEKRTFAWVCHNFSKIRAARCSSLPFSIWMLSWWVKWVAVYIAKTYICRPVLLCLSFKLTAQMLHFLCLNNFCRWF